MSLLSLFRLPLRAENSTPCVPEPFAFSLPSILFLAWGKSQAWPHRRGQLGDSGPFSLGFHLVGFSWALAGTCPSLSPPQVLAAYLCSACQLTSPFLASPVPCPPPPTSGLTSVSFALFCYLTGIIKIRINRQVSISPLLLLLLLLLSGGLAVSRALSQALAGCLSLSLSSSFPCPGTEHQPPIPAARQGLPRLKTCLLVGRRSLPPSAVSIKAATLGCWSLRSPSSPCVAVSCELYQLCPSAELLVCGAGSCQHGLVLCH